MSQFKSSLVLIFTIYFSFAQTNTAWAAPIPEAQVQTLDNNITAAVYAVKKTKHYVAVELGFNNPTDGYLEFTPTEIYLDSADTYSRQPLTVSQIQEIEQRNPGMGIVPGALSVGLGLAALGTGIFGKNGASKGLAVAALGMGGAYLLTKGLENQAQANRLITFENNDLNSVKRLPPGMTLGGVMFFPATKAPQSITIVAKTKNGGYERKTFDISTKKSGRKARSGKHLQRD